jgi:iron(III) transport system permease protein
VTALDTRPARRPAVRRTGSPDLPMRTLTVLVVVLLVLVVVYPVVRMLVDTFGEGGFGDAVAATLDLPGLGTAILNTLVVLAISTPVAVLVGAAFAWVNERSDARVGWVSQTLPIMPMLVPPIAGAIGWSFLASPTVGYLNVGLRGLLGTVGITMEEGPLDVYSFPGLILVYSVYMLPHVYLTVAAALRNVDPALEEAARTNGANPWRTFVKVTLPAVKPAILGGALLALVMGLALYSVPVILGARPHIDILAVDIVRLMTAEFPPRTDVAVVLGAVLMIVIGGIYLVQVRVLRNARHATIGGRGRRQALVRLGAWRRPVQVVMLGYLLATTVLPFLGLLFVSLQPFWSGRVALSALSFDQYVDILVDDLTAASALRNSVVLGIVGATVALLFTALVVYVTQYHVPARLRTAINFLTKLPAALSHIVIGIAFVIAFAGPPFLLAGTTAILLLAYVCLYLPQASVSAETAMSQVGRELSEAARVSGASSGRSLRKVVLPLMVPGLAAGWALVFVLMAGDITASVMLAGTRNPVVGSQVLSMWNSGTYPGLAALAVVVTLACTVVVLGSVAVTRWLDGRHR